MHHTAMQNAKIFFDSYSQSINSTLGVKVLDIGSQDVNGSIRSVTPNRFEYVGVDFVQGKGVDKVLESPYDLPFDDNSFDIVVSSSCFEHSEMFWVVFLEIMRVLKPTGLFYLNAPSNGLFHRFPVDCWRFYPDCGSALVAWGKRNNLKPMLLESYVSNQNMDVWNDFVAVFLKDESHLKTYPNRIIDIFKDFKNGKKHGADVFLNYSELPEDLSKINVIKQVCLNNVKIL